MKKETEENNDMHANSDDKHAVSKEYIHYDPLNEVSELESKKDIINIENEIEQNRESTKDLPEQVGVLSEIYNTDKSYDFTGVAISGSSVYFDRPFMFPRDFPDKLEAVSDLQAKPVDYIGEVAAAKIDPALEIEEEKEVYTEEDWKRYF